MQNRSEHKKDWCKWSAQGGPAPETAGLPTMQRTPAGAAVAAADGGPGEDGKAPGYCLASSVETSFRETELMQ